MISKTITDEVINKTNIVEVIGEYLPLQKKGNSFVGLCPFHADKNPSMSVNQEKHVFNCFSCGTKGSVIFFVSKFEHISMDQATIKLAKRLGIEIDENTSKRYEQEERAYRVLDTATRFFEFYLQNTLEGKKALSYLEERLISNNIIEDKRIGLSGSETDLLQKALKAEKISLIDALELGLVNDLGNGKFEDVFTNRIIFPITNKDGRVVAFSGRIYDKNSKAKYINSKENIVFQKGKILYNLYQAMPFIKEKNQVFVYEGFMDVFASEKANIKNACATMGTALTKDHINNLLALTKNIVLCFDGDEAGIYALKNAVRLFASYSIIPFAVIIDENLDPDDYAKKYGPDKLNEYLHSHIQNAFEYLYMLARKGLNMTDLTDQINFKNEVFSFLRLTRDQTVIDFFLKKLSLEIKTTNEQVMSEFGVYRPNNNLVQTVKELPKIKDPVRCIPTSKNYMINYKRTKASFDTIIRCSIRSKDLFIRFLEATSSDLTVKFLTEDFVNEFTILFEIGNFYQNHIDDTFILPEELQTSFDEELNKQYEVVINSFIDQKIDQNSFDDCVKVIKNDFLAISIEEAKEKKDYTEYINLIRKYNKQ